MTEVFDFSHGEQGAVEKEVVVKCDETNGLPGCIGAPNLIEARCSYSVMTT